MSETNAIPFKAGVGVQSLEQSEKAISVLHVEADAVVLDLKKDFVGVGEFGIRADANGGWIAVTGKFERVGNELGENLPDHPGIGVDFRERVDVPFDAAAFGLEFEFLEDGFDGFIEVDGTEVEIAPTEPRIGENAVEQFAHLLGRLEDDAEVFGGGSIEFPGEVLLEQSSEGFDVPKRSTQIVRDSVAKRFEFARGFTQLRGVAFELLFHHVNRGRRRSDEPTVLT